MVLYSGVLGAIAGTVSDGPRPTRNHRSNSRAWAARAAETNGYPLTALRGQVCGFNWRTLKAYKSPKSNSARSLSTRVGWTNRCELCDQLRAFGVNDRRKFASGVPRTHPSRLILGSHTKRPYLGSSVRTSWKRAPKNVRSPRFLVGG